MHTREIALRAFEKHVSLYDLAHYTGILSLQGLARLAIHSDDPGLLEQARARLLPFVRGDHRFSCNFRNYLCGGNGTAYLFWRGVLPEAAEAVRFYADELMHEAPRDGDGIFSMPADGGEPKIWIDTAFAVTPFLLFAGRALGEDSYIEEAFQQTRKMVNVFRDDSCGLLHQSRGFAGPGRFSEDHWSRGNGWGLLALTELVQFLAEDDRRRPESETLFRDLLSACLRVQDADGLWRQELTDSGSYIETSGSGLILYAFGVGLEKRLLPESARERYRAGLEEYGKYITPDGSVFHTCRGCLCPDGGLIASYKATPPVRNDPHAFGPVVLAFGQAHRIGIDEIGEAA